jgi:hypothetical protein
VLLDRGEVADAAPRVHLLHQTVTNARVQARRPTLAPFLEAWRPTQFEPVEETSPNFRPAWVEVARVYLHRPLSQGERGAVGGQELPADRCPQDGDCLGQGMPAVLVGRIGPQQIDQIVTGELFSRLERKPNQQGEMLARAIAYRFTGGGEQEGSAQREQAELGDHNTIQNDGRRHNKGGRSTKCQHVESQAIRCDFHCAPGTASTTVLVKNHPLRKQTHPIQRWLPLPHPLPRRHIADS